MKEICENIFKKSRKNAGFEQIEAADKLGVSARSLQNYESELNVTLPPMDVVRNMCILYRDKWLAYRYMKKSPLGEFLPDFTVEPSLAVATLSMLDDFTAVQNYITRVVSVTKDGKIEKNEVKDWQDFCEVANNLINSLNSLVNNSKGGEIHVD